MLQEGWEETIARKTATAQLDNGVGCFLQIHPLAISDNLTHLGHSQLTVGRESSCGLCLPDSSVSRQHALIEKVGDGYFVTDLGSTNGTCVNEQKVSSVELTPGDRVQFGSYIFKFLSTNHIEMQYHEAIYSMMTRDGLTGTLNKRSFTDIINREFRRAVTRRTSLSLILFDIDHFKSVNDTHGHLAGDEVLQEMGRRISSVIAEHDVFARYGGEEFAILLSDVELAEAVELAERCRAVVAAEPFATSIQPLPVTISVGVAELSRSGCAKEPADLIEAADAQLYAAKDGGRNQVCTAD
ncbi:MAG: GGDEF domain-containing protein [Planctomycetaceae bacterium]|nr:GGDEF domain-containing protein [Planctomycetaceae bacterium]